MEKATSESLLVGRAKYEKLSKNANLSFELMEMIKNSSPLNRKFSGKTTFPEKVSARSSKILTTWFLEPENCSPRKSLTTPSMLSHEPQ